MKTALRIGWILLCLTLAFAARCWNVRDVFVDGRVYFVDADCYSRMTRVSMVVEQPGSIIRHHDFENWPQGTTPHTTAPLDYLIAALKSVVDLGFTVFDPHRTSVLHGQTLDVAGALMAPLLGMAGALFLAFWWWRFRVRFGGATLLFYAISPILVHGTLLGRPDHQALLIFLLTVAFGGELALAAPATEGSVGPNRKVWGLVAGVTWGLSLWVSLYEPLILLGLVSGLWLVADRRALREPTRRPGWIAAAIIVLLSLVIEGWRVGMPDAAGRTYFAAWSQTIGELSHLDLQSPLLFSWLGWLVVAAPVLLFLARKLDRRALPLLGMLVALFALTIWQVRWGYFLALVYAYSLPFQLRALRFSWPAWTALVASLWPVLKGWDSQLYPGELAEDRVAMQRAELAALRELVMVTTGENAGPILAPWWLSPPIAYWTHNPCVAGSSHQSLPGIVDTAKFFLITSPESAASILRARRVRWVLADEPSRVKTTSGTLLSVAPAEQTLADVISIHPEEAPEFLAEWNGPGANRAEGTRFYRLYRVDDAKLP